MDNLAPGAQRRVDVLALVAAETVSGPGRQLAGLARALADENIVLHVLVLWRQGHPFPPYAEYLADAGVPCDVVPDRGPLDRTVARLVRDAIERLRPRIVQTHGYKASAALWLLRRTGERVPWVGFYHGHTTENWKARLYHRLDRRLLGAADRIVVMSARQEHEFRSHGNRVQLIYNAIVPLPATQSGESRALRDRLARAPRPLIGVVGRLSREKGVDLFVRACGVLARRGRTFTAVIAGDGPERAALEGLARSEGVGDATEFLGSVSDPATLYSELDLLVLPSRSEGLPNVLLEGLAANLPVIATAVGAVPDVLGSPDAGQLIEPESVAALGDSIDAALARPGTPGTPEGRARTCAAFSLENRLRKHVALYRSLDAGIVGGSPVRKSVRR